MTATETKKLLTQARTGGMCLAGPGMLRAGIDACRHDAAIAHEQREVIRKLVEVVTVLASGVEAEIMGEPRPDLPKDWDGYVTVLVAAEPYLD